MRHIRWAGSRTSSSAPNASASCATSRHPSARAGSPKATATPRYLVGTEPYGYHARVFEGVAKSQFSLQDSCFQKWKACPDTLLNEFTLSHTLAWQAGPPASFEGLPEACAPRRITQRILKLRAVPIGTVLNLRTSASQKSAAVPRRARIEGS